MQEKIKKILAVKASAGSGKTTDLSKRIIDLLHQGQGNILAVTFTNDAAQEMYNRVLESLMELIFEEDAIIPNLVRKEHQASPSVYKKYLLNILRSPQQLRITTIDSFFTQILKAIPIELELGPQYSIYDEEELATLKDEFEQQFCEHLMGKKIFNISDCLPYFSLKSLFFDSWFSRTESNLMPLFDYLQSFQNHEALEDIHALLQPVFRNINHSEDEIKKGIRLLHDALQKHLEDFGHQNNLLKKVLPKLALFDRFPDLSSISIFERESLQDHSWFKKGLARHPEIDDLFCSARASAVNLLQQVHQVKNILYHYYAWTYIRQWNGFLQENNVLTFDSIKMHVYNLGRQYQDVHLDEKSLFINDLFFHLDGEITHFLFDEFQDTDSFQWMFFWLLIEEILSQDNYKTLYYVGDPKQSLYRFRGAVPELFDLVFKTLEKYNPSSELRSLDYNYRSDISLLRFFNDFFEFWSEQNPQFIYEKQLKPGEDASAQCQLMPGDKHPRTLSSLEIAIIPPLSKIADYEEEEGDPFAIIVDRIRQLRSNYNCRLHDIAILGYTKAELQQIGSLLKSAGINYIIDDNPPFETYRSYHIITSILSFLALRSSQSLLRAYYYYVYQPEYELIPDAMNPLPRDTVLLGYEEVVNAFEKAGLLNLESILNTLQEKVDRVPLDSLVWSIIRLFHLPPPLPPDKQHLAPRWEDEKLFLLDFLDFTHQYSQQHGYELMRFLGNLQLHPERFKTMPRISANRIRLYTIHKSKGLQFPFVFYIYKPMKIRADSSEPAFLYFYQEHDLSRLPLPCQIPLQRITALCYPAPVQYLSNKSFSIPFFSKFNLREDITRDFYQEKTNAENFMEELNKSYVACTRAQKGLFVLYQQAKTNQNEINLFAPYLEEKNIPETDNGSEDSFQNFVIPHEISCLPEKLSRECAEIVAEKAAASLESYLSQLPETADEPVPFKSEDIVSLGKLVHFLMQEATFNPQTGTLSFSDAQKRALRMWGYSLNRSQLDKASEIAGRTRKDSRLTELYAQAETVLREAYFIYQGRNYFLDCLFILKDRIVIVDYKVTRISLLSPYAQKDRQKYFQQLECYMNICRSYSDYSGKKTETYLLNIFAEEPAYTWITGPSAD